MAGGLLCNTAGRDLFRLDYAAAKGTIAQFQRSRL